MKHTGLTLTLNGADPFEIYKTRNSVRTVLDARFTVMFSAKLLGRHYSSNVKTVNEISLDLNINIVHFYVN